MKLLMAIRRRLAWKLLASYLIVIALGSLVLLITAEFVMPKAFQHHLAAMTARMGHDVALADDLFANFRRAVTEALTLSALAAIVTAMAFSVYVSRRIVSPVQALARASEHIADGHYGERAARPDSALAAESIDEFGHLAVSFDRMAATLQKTETLRQELIGNVAHELRTPLASIKGYMEGLIDGVLPATPTTFQQVHREADRLQRLVYDLQELSRAEAGSIRLDMRPLAVADLVGATLARLRPQYADKQVSLETDIPANLPAVRGDEDRLGQVLLNVVGNALQYTPAGGTVHVSARREDGVVRLVVSDTGIGIASKYLPHLFDRFYRVDDSRSRVGGGTGIGLTIARHLIEAQGGQITAYSQGLGQGSSFSITIPIA